MSVLLFLLIVLSTLWAIVGLINPSLAMRSFARHSRKNVLLIYVPTLFFLSLFIGLANTSKSGDENNKNHIDTNGKRNSASTDNPSATDNKSINDSREAGLRNSCAAVATFTSFAIRASIDGVPKDHFFDPIKTFSKDYPDPVNIEKMLRLVVDEAYSGNSRANDIALFRKLGQDEFTVYANTRCRKSVNIN